MLHHQCYAAPSIETHIRNTIMFTLNRSTVFQLSSVEQASRLKNGSILDIGKTVALGRKECEFKQKLMRSH